MLTILKEAGPEIFVRSHSLIVPSGSLATDPSNEMLSAGKAIYWSAPAMAIGDWLSLQPSLEYSFLLGKNITANKLNNINKERSIFSYIKGLNGYVYLVEIINIPQKPLMIYHNNAMCKSTICTICK